MRRNKLIPLSQILAETTGDIMSVNKIILIGNLGKAPELKEGETPICKFSLATTDYKKETTWHNLVCFGKVAENCARYLVKGSSVYVEGKQEHKSYDAKDGTKKYFSQVVANNVQFLSAKNPEKTENGETKQMGDQFVADDCPF